MLVVNNLRDISGDLGANKRTIAVRLGDPNTRQLYTACLVVPFIIVALVGVGGIGFIDLFPAGALFGLVPAPLASLPLRRINRGDVGPDLVPVLVATARLQLAFGLLLALGVAISK